MASIIDSRPITPIDVSANALYVDDTWRQPFAQLRAEMPVSWRPESPFGSYWSALSKRCVSALPS